MDYPQVRGPLQMCVRYSMNSEVSLDPVYDFLFPGFRPNFDMHISVFHTLPNENSTKDRIFLQNDGNFPT